jgi:hypothetical protein
LVSEYFVTASSITPEQFFAMTKQTQADLIWKALFIDRSPISEACRGVGRYLIVKIQANRLLFLFLLISFLTSWLALYLLWALLFLFFVFSYNTNGSGFTKRGCES